MLQKVSWVELLSGLVELPGFVRRSVAQESHSHASVMPEVAPIWCRDARHPAPSSITHLVELPGNLAGLSYLAAWLSYQVLLSK